MFEDLIFEGLQSCQKGVWPESAARGAGSCAFSGRAQPRARRLRSRPRGIVVPDDDAQATARCFSWQRQPRASTPITGRRHLANTGCKDSTGDWRSSCCSNSTARTRPGDGPWAGSAHAAARRTPTTAASARTPRADILEDRNPPGMRCAHPLRMHKTPNARGRATVDPTILRDATRAPAARRPSDRAAQLPTRAAGPQHRIRDPRRPREERR